MGVPRLFGGYRILALLLLTFGLLSTVGLFYKWFSPVPDPMADPMAEKRRIPVQYKERDLVDYNLYYKELATQSPVFRFVNLNNTFSHASRVPQFDGTKPVVFVITPTYKRGRLQRAVLTNMCSSMRQSSNVFWILIEDELQKTELVKHFLLECGIPTVHMNFKSYFHVQATVDQRNAALEWIRRNTDISFGHSVFFFADDDNTYSPDLYDEMRYTKKVSVWPVGLAGGAPAEGPIAKDGKVVDWMSGFAIRRKFPIDMAGFAVNTQFWNRTSAKFVHDFEPGFSETDFLESLGITEADLEPRADNCSRVGLRSFSEWFEQTSQRLNTVEDKC